MRPYVLMAWLLCLSPGSAAAVDPVTWLQTLEAYPHVSLIDSRESTVRDMEVGTGALQKVRGSWRFKSSTRRSGQLRRETWQIVDGYSAAEVFDSVRQEIESGATPSPTFSCSGRSCGPSVQWANRVFQQRLLYGRDDTQLYVVYEAVGDDTPAWVLMMYAAGRTAERQYLHIDLLQVE